MSLFQRISWSQFTNFIYILFIFVLDCILQKQSFQSSYTQIWRHVYTQYIQSLQWLWYYKYVWNSTTHILKHPIKKFVINIQRYSIQNTDLKLMWFLHGDNSKKKTKKLEVGYRYFTTFLQTHVFHAILLLLSCLVLALLLSVKLRLSILNRVYWYESEMDFLNDINKIMKIV